MAFTAVTLAMEATNEILKSQGIESDLQNALLDPIGTAIGYLFSHPTNVNQRYRPPPPTEEEIEAWEREKERRAFNDELEAELRLVNNRRANEQHRLLKGLNNRTAAQSQKLNKTYQTAVNKAIANPLAQKTIQPQRIKRTTEQQVADRELQQRVQNLKAQLQPAGTTARPTRALPPSVSTATPSRPLPPSVPLSGTGPSQLLLRVMTEFNMSKREAQKYIKRHGSD